MILDLDFSNSIATWSVCDVQSRNEIWNRAKMKVKTAQVISYISKICQRSLMIA